MDGRKAQAPIAGIGIVLGIVLIVIATLLNWQWLVYVGIVIFVAGIMAKKFIGA